MASGYRRRILIEPAPGCVSAELEDDYHRMVVVLTHAAGIVTRIDSEMKRAPWTSCPGAMRQLEATFAGQPLSGFVRRGEKLSNCTHLHDLALFAAAHAEDAVPTAYDVFVSDPVAGARIARLDRDGAVVLEWRFAGDRIVAPDALAGRTVGELGDWIAAQDRAVQEAARILRWAAILALGRAMEIPAGISATAFPGGTCFTFQPAMALTSTRLPDVDRDFSAPGAQPMADRAPAFAAFAGFTQ